MLTIPRLALALVVSTLLGTCAYFLFTQHYALRELEKSIRIAEIASSRLTYGVVRSVDILGRSITMTYTEPSSGNKIDVLVRVGEHARIAEQRLEPVGAAVYTSLSEPVPGTLSDLAPGTRIAIDVEMKTAEGLRTSLILFGNPL